MKWYNNLDLVKNELQNARIQNLASAPSSPVEGQVYYNTTDHKFYVYNGTDWQVLNEEAVTNITANSPLNSTGGKTPELSIQAATAVQNGYMPSTDKAKLDNATSDATADTLMKRDANGRAKVADPADTGDIATKAYVDSVAQGLDIKASVRVATTGSNLDLNGLETIDTISLQAGDRVLVKDQTAPAENGIYVVSSGDWTRASDTDSWDELISAFVFVEQGSQNTDTGWVCTVDRGGTLGTTAITWSQFSGAGSIEAGEGLTKTGNTININYDNSTIYVDADVLKVKAGGITDTHLADGAALAEILDDDGHGSLLDADKVDGIEGADLVQKTRTITAGSGLTGGGDLSADRTLTVDVDDTTIEINTNKLRVKAGSLTDTHIATANKDGATNVPSMRTLGTGSQQAAAGDHTHAQLHDRQHAMDSASDHAAAGVGDKGKFAHANATTGAVEWALIQASDLPEHTHPYTSKYSATLAGGATYEDVVHNLGSRDVIVQIYDINTPYAQIMADVEHKDTNTVTIRFASTIPSNTYRVIVIG